MKRPLRVTESAAAELGDAVRWHEEKRPGLGIEHHELVATALDFIGERPDVGSPVSNISGFSVRRRLIPRFPYQVIYYARPDEIVIVALAHTSRRPGYWRSRLASEAPPNVLRLSGRRPPRPGRDELVVRRSAPTAG